MVKNAAMPWLNENEVKSSCGKQLQLSWLSHPSSPGISNERCWIDAKDLYS